MSCTHRTCVNYLNCKGVGAVFILPEYKKNGNKLNNVTLLGREVSGQYANKYNLCGGKMDPKDNGCFISAIRREIKEELKINLNNPDEFDKIFRCSRGIRCFEIRKTLIFVGILPKGFSKTPIKLQMRNDYLTHPNNAYREMDDIEWFKTDNLSQIENIPCEVSPYAENVIKLVITNNILSW